MIYNAVLVSGIEQSELALHIHTSTLFRFFSHIGHYRVLPVEFSMLYIKGVLFLVTNVYFYWLYILLQLPVLSGTAEIYCFLSQKEPSVKYG